MPQLGFLHLGNEGLRPFEDLEDELNKKALCDIAGAVIVLPEAFNFAQEYFDGSCHRKLPKIPRDKALADLQATAKKRNVSFVAGLIGQQHGRALTSAYWIPSSGADPLLMCHKISNDKSGHYESPTLQEHWNNPASYNGLCLGVLICADALCEPPAHHYAAQLERQVRESDHPNKVLCVPARMVSFDLPFSDLCCIRANVGARRSYVTRGHETLAQAADPAHRSEICLIQLQ